MEAPRPAPEGRRPPPCPAVLGALRPLGPMPLTGVLGGQWPWSGLGHSGTRTLIFPWLHGPLGPHLSACGAPTLSADTVGPQVFLAEARHGAGLPTPLRGARGRSEPLLAWPGHPDHGTGRQTQPRWLAQPGLWASNGLCFSAPGRVIVASTGVSAAPGPAPKLGNKLVQEPRNMAEYPSSGYPMTPARAVSHSVEGICMRPAPVLRVWKEYARLDR